MVMHHKIIKMICQKQRNARHARTHTQTDRVSLLVYETVAQQMITYLDWIFVNQKSAPW